jgi:hypothetical protein
VSGQDDVPLPRHWRGKRPQFFDDAAVDELLGIVLGLTQEVSVLRDRLDSVERLLDAKGTVTRAELEAYVPDAAAAAERAQVRNDYVQRVFRVIRREAGTYSTAESEQHVAGVEKELA